MAESSNPLAVLRERVKAIQWQSYANIAEVRDTMLAWIDELLPPKPLPCPFCGDDNVEIEYRVVVDRFVVHCTGCGCRVDFGVGPNTVSEGAATLAAWNSRTEASDGE